MCVHQHKLYIPSLYQEREGVLNEWQSRLERRHNELEELRRDMQASIARREADADARDKAIAVSLSGLEERRNAVDALESRVRKVCAPGLPDSALEYAWMPACLSYVGCMLMPAMYHLLTLWQNACKQYLKFMKHVQMPLLAVQQLLQSTVIAAALPLHS